MMKKAQEVSLFGIATLILLTTIIYKLIAGKEIEFYEMTAIGVFSMFFLNAITWGNKKENNGILQDEELGQRIVEKASKISYTILYFILLAAVLADKLINGTSNVILFAVFISAMVVLPTVQYIIEKKYS